MLSNAQVTNKNGLAHVKSFKRLCLFNSYLEQVGTVIIGCFFSLCASFTKTIGYSQKYVKEPFFRPLEMKWVEYGKSGAASLQPVAATACLPQLWEFHSWVHLQKPQHLSKGYDVSNLPSASFPRNFKTPSDDGGSWEMTYCGIMSCKIGDFDPLSRHSIKLVT